MYWINVFFLNIPSLFVCPFGTVHSKPTAHACVKAILNQSINQSINQPINQSINQSINQYLKHDQVKVDKLTLSGILDFIRENIPIATQIKLHRREFKMQ